MYFVLSRAWNKEKTLSPYEESNLMESNGWKIVFLEKHQGCLIQEHDEALWQSSLKCIFLNVFYHSMDRK